MERPLFLAATRKEPSPSMRNDRGLATNLTLTKLFVRGGIIIGSLALMLLRVITVFDGTVITLTAWT
jgi:hypothetical protein